MPLLNGLDSLANKLPANTAVLLCGHGSRAPDYQQGLKQLCQKVGEQLASVKAGSTAPSVKISYGFLEHASPTINLALDDLVQKGATTIYAVPCLLFAATHAQYDIPAILKQYQQDHPHINIHTSNELGRHALMLDALQNRIQESLSPPLKNTLLKNTLLEKALLIVISKGTSVAEANQKTKQITHVVSERLGIVHSKTLYVGPGFPSLEESLEDSLNELSISELKNIIVAPYFLFGGKITQRIYRDVDFLVKQNPLVNFHTTNCLGSQTAVVNTVISQLNQLAQLVSNEK